MFVNCKLQHHVALWVGTGVLEEHATVIIRIVCLRNIFNYLPDHMLFQPRSVQSMFLLL